MSGHRMCWTVCAGLYVLECMCWTLCVYIYCTHECYQSIIVYRVVQVLRINALVHDHPNNTCMQKPHTYAFTKMMPRLFTIKSPYNTGMHTGPPKAICRGIQMDTQGAGVFTLCQEMHMGIWVQSSNLHRQQQKQQQKFSIHLLSWGQFGIPSTQSVIIHAYMCYSSSWHFDIIGLFMTGK